MSSRRPSLAKRLLQAHPWLLTALACGVVACTGPADETSDDTAPAPADVADAGGDAEPDAEDAQADTTPDSPDAADAHDGDVSDDAGDTGTPLPQEGWHQHTLGGTYNDEAKGVAAALDGGMWVVGYTESWGAGDWDGLVVRADSCGKPLWSRAYGGDKKDDLHGVAPTQDGGAAAVGTTYSFGKFVDAWVVKVDAKGDPLWSQAYGGSGHDQAGAVTETNDADLVVLGETYNFGPGTPDNHNMLIFRVAGDTGDIVWEQTLGGATDGDAGFALLRTDGPEGNLLVAGASESYSHGRDDVWLVKLTPQGKLLWTKSIGDDEDDESRAIAPDGQGGFLVTGFTRTWTHGKSDAFVLRVDAQGSPLSMRHYGHSERERGYGAFPLSGGGVLVAGHTQSYGDGDIDALVMVLKPDGKVGTARLLRGKKDDEIVATARAGDGHLLWAGRTESMGAGQRDAWFGKLHVSGAAGCNAHTLSSGKVKTGSAKPKVLSTPPTIATGAKSAVAKVTTTVLSPTDGQQCLPATCSPAP